MKKIALILAAIVTLTAFTTVLPTWQNDDPHSQLGFTVSHLGINDVSGTFNDFDVTLQSSKPDFSDAVIELSAKTASIDTRVEARNNHLKSADFFDVEKYPTMNFKSTAVKPAGKNKYKLTGDLTLHGITKPVTMDLLYKGTIENPMSKNQTAGFQVTGTINRSDFNIGPKFPAPMISNEVMIKADGEFIQNENK
ncbi:YceI family protein [Flavisolibacter ginsengisoli]|jgi:polyisoprenoid-binding protein YceI|uniref:Polyisoprenoid-binding protein YceI n=1 Tax=Flavisolibacter ginsengisoli DSM 18119 TaxID=1121884 RepID=A0A1M4SDU6_9BACT|nr:YceI family protein [Flavisolibacter ginsengisoli]SHE30335.1 Polyisoprenoid-binding protein YceI [Flavisolibacter ginsengisoli DSM 18119]